MLPLLKQLNETIQSLEEGREKEEYIAKKAGQLLSEMMYLHARTQFEKDPSLKNRYDDWMEYLQYEYSIIKQHHLDIFAQKVAQAVAGTVRDLENGVYYRHNK